jgi:hypothetical protein
MSTPYVLLAATATAPLSDNWTDVARCARGTFVGFVRACTCGWYGGIRPNTIDGFRDCQRALRQEHLSQLWPAAAATGGPSRARLTQSLVLDGHIPVGTPTG